MSKPVKGHPAGLMTLFFSEMWERFCYYGMRVLLTLYLVKSLMKGDAEASLLYGAYTGLVYAAPILGGRMADKFLGYRYSVLLGAFLMAIGEFLILGGNDTFLMIGMGALIIGNGYFKANISTIVGKLYEDGDPRRDSGFTIFYIGINVGAFLATTVVAFVGETYGFHYGFGLAGIGMLLGLLIFWIGRHTYAAAPGLEVTEEGNKRVVLGLKKAHLVVFFSLLLIPVCYLLILKNEILNYLFLILFIYVAYSLIKAGIKEDKEQQVNVWKSRMIALIIFIVINIVFWACFEQAGTSLTLFADRNVDRFIFDWEMPASMTQFFNPLFIIVFGSVFSVMWGRLSKIGKNPSIPMKFSLGILQLGFGFLLTYVGYQIATDNLVPLYILTLLYLLHTTGELFLSPIGLSMVTKLSPQKMAGTAMGAWFLSFAIANLLGGQIAALTGDGHEDDKDKDKTKFTVESTVLEALVINGTEDQFANWESFYSVPEDMTDRDGRKIPRKIKKDVELSKNIDYSTYLQVEDWVRVRENLESGSSFGSWKEIRAQQDTLKSAAAWLNLTNWENLKSRYKRIIESDLKEKDRSTLTKKDWLYFRGGLSDLEVADETPMNEVLMQLKDNVQSAKLARYIHVFTILGLVLVGFAILIALLSKPLNKLMHGIT